MRKLPARRGGFIISLIMVLWLCDWALWLCVAVPEFSLVGGGRGIRFVLGLFYVLVWGLSIEYFWSFILAPCYGISRISDLDEGRNSFLISRPPEGGLFRLG